MVPTPIPLPAWRNRRHSNPLSVVIWATPYVFLVPAMVAVGLVLLVAPKRRVSWELYAKGLAALLETSLNAAVAYRAAAPSRRTSQDPACARRRPAEAARPGGRRGVSRPAAHTRTKR